MKKHRLSYLFISILLVGTFFIAGCNAVLKVEDKKIEPGELETRQYDYDDFIEVDISSAFSYEIQEADSWSVEITAGRNLFKYIIVTKSARELDIDMNTPGVSIWTNGYYTRPKVTITMPELAALDSSGATDGTVIGFSSDGNLDISGSGASEIELMDITAGRTTMDLSGASKISGTIQVDRLELDVDSASKVQLEGSVDFLAVDCSGASQADLSSFIARDVDISLSGASKSTISLDGKLDVKLSGASTLEYIGEPVIGDMEVTGASTFRKK
jgi:hypothetical protein